RPLLVLCAVQSRSAAVDEGDRGPEERVASRGETQDRCAAGVGILLRAEMAEPLQHLDAPLRDALGDLRGQRWADVGGGLAAHDHYFRTDLAESRERAVVRPHRVHACFDLRSALQL